MVLVHELFRGQLDLDPRGYCRTASEGETATIRLTVINLSGDPQQSVLACSNITNQCYDVGTLAPGETRTFKLVGDAVHFNVSGQVVMADQVRRSGAAYQPATRSRATA